MSSKNRKKITVQRKILIVIIATALVINLISLTVGALFLTNNIMGAIESDMLVAVDIADQYVTKELELLKQKTREISTSLQMMSALYSGQSWGTLLENIYHQQQTKSNFIGFAVFNHNELLDSAGAVTVHSDLIKEPFMQIAVKGGSAVSTTMHCPDDTLVMYVCTPINDNLILTAILPGLHFSELISQFTFWESGHLFIDDGDGYVISNYRTEWVKQRVNFIDMAKEDKSYADLAAMVKRGIAKERGTGVYSMNGVQRMCAFRPVSSPTEDWFVGIIAPLSESSLKNIPNTVFLSGIITIILSAAAAIIATAVLRRPYEEVDRLREAAEAMSVSKSAFLATMSHEIRTPMNSIIGFSELALDNETGLKTRDYLNKIKTNAQWLLQIINDILDISKVESGKMVLENIPFEMHELFSSCRTLIMPKAVEKGITLYFYVEPSIGRRPLGDPTRLRQILVNLLSNAVKFTNTGMVKLHAALKEMHEKTITMYFEVKDSGIGMTSEQMNKVFAPYVQAEADMTRKYGGTGLGLSITKNIIELMGGTLSAESSPGIGSKFCFELTFDTIDVKDSELFDEKVIINEIDKPAFSGEILLCEDNTMNQQVICEHLARVGLKTVVAENGKIGLDLVKSRLEKCERMFDLIFMDMHMPVMDGLEASEKIMDLGIGVPVVAMTANIMFNDREIYKRNGMNDCVGKPFTSQELWRCLMKYLTPVSTVKESKYSQIEADFESQKNLQALFIKTNKNIYNEITEAMEAGDITKAHRITHSLKGNAGQIGKIILQKAAADIEYMLKDGKNMVTGEQLKILKTELDMVLNEFAQNADVTPKPSGFRFG